jgi:hypothetical protein
VQKHPKTVSRRGHRGRREREAATSHRLQVTKGRAQSETRGKREDGRWKMEAKSRKGEEGRVSKTTVFDFTILLHNLEP